MRRPLSPIRYTASLNESDLMLCGCARLRSTTASSRQVQRGQAALCRAIPPVKVVLLNCHLYSWPWMPTLEKICAGTSHPNSPSPER